MPQRRHELPPVANLDLLPNVMTDLVERYYPTLDRIREETPVVRIRKRDKETFAFLRADAAREILQNWRLFTSGGDRVYIADPLIPSHMDPPEHTKWRMLLQGAFAPREVREREPRMRELARSLVARIVDKGSCDFVADFGKPYPVMVFCEILGLPQADMAQLAEWEAKVWTPPEQDPSGEINRTGLAFLKTYIGEKLEERRRRPDDSLVTKLLNSEVDGRRPTDHELTMLILLLCLGGFHTTKGALSRMLLHLARTPEHRRLIASDPSAIPTFIDEILRAYSLGETFRTVTEDTVLDGCPLKRGDIVSAHKPAANRDPRVFENPAQIDPLRKHNPHLAFGSGPHICLGMHLARTDMRIALEEWHMSIPEYAVPKGAEVVEQLFSGVGPYAIPLVWDVRAPSRAAG